MFQHSDEARMPLGRVRSFSQRITRAVDLDGGKLHSGNSEILNWVGVAGAVEHLDSELVCARLPDTRGNRDRSQFCKLGLARFI